MTLAPAQHDRPNIPGALADLERIRAQRPAVAALIAALEECRSDPTPNREDRPTVTREQLDLIPDRLLDRHRSGCSRLIEWLDQRGWQMTLAELDAERRHRKQGAR